MKLEKTQSEIKNRKNIYNNDDENKIFKKVFNYFYTCQKYIRIRFIFLIPQTSDAIS